MKTQPAELFVVRDAGISLRLRLLELSILFLIEVNEGEDSNFEGDHVQGSNA